MAGQEIYKIASTNIGNVFIVSGDNEMWKGQFSNNIEELRFSALSNLWDFTEHGCDPDLKPRSLKLRSHWIHNIEHGTTVTTSAMVPVESDNSVSPSQYI